MAAVQSISLRKTAGYLPVVQYLLDQRADVNKAANDGWTSMHAAASNGHAEVLTCLMDGGASLTGKPILATDPVPDVLPIDVAANEDIIRLIRRRRAQQLIRKHTEEHEEVYPLVLKRNRRW